MATFIDLLGKGAWLTRERMPAPARLAASVLGAGFPIATSDASTTGSAARSVSEATLIPLAVL
jgi:hypothetical protein